MAQYIIETGLKKFYPFLDIVGEEGDKGIPSEFDFEILSEKIFSDLLEKSEDLNGENLKEMFENVEFESSNFCVFIDPLDGTRGFVKGNMDVVTTLITLCVDSVPQIGIIGKGFMPEKKGVFEPRTFVGCRDVPCVLQVRDLGYLEHVIERVIPAFEEFDEEGKV